MDRLTGAPFPAADFEHLHQDGFTESGAGALDLTVGANHFNSLQPEAGVRVSRPFTASNGAILLPELRFGMRRELLDTTATSAAVLTAATSAGALTTQGVAADRTMVDIGARVTLSVTGSTDLYVGYAARVSANQTDQTFGIGARAAF